MFSANPYVENVTHSSPAMKASGRFHPGPNDHSRKHRKCAHISAAHSCSFLISLFFSISSSSRSCNFLISLFLSISSSSTLCLISLTSPPQTMRIYSSRPSETDSLHGFHLWNKRTATFDPRLSRKFIGQGAVPAGSLICERTLAEVRSKLYEWFGSDRVLVLFL